MNFSKRSSVGILIAVILIAVIAMFLNRKNQEKPLESVVRKASAPPATFFSKFGSWTSDKFSFLTEIGTLKRDNQNLFEENVNLKAQIAKLEDVKNENNELRAQIELAPREEFELTSAFLIGRDLDLQSEVVHLNRGKRDGIEEQMAVIIGDGVLIGKVIKVLEASCDVELLISRSSKVNAEIVKKETKGIARGQFGTSIVLDMIPQAIKIEKGEPIITSGVGGILPRGLLIGYTQEATPTADQLFQRSTLELPFQMDKLRMVWIVTGIK